MNFSFIIPARNEYETLKETIRNIYKTTRKYSIEIIVVDDNSNEPLSHYIPSKVKYHRCDIQQGASKARNIGATIANGDILVFVDAHVCFQMGWLDHIIRSGVFNNQMIVGAAIHLVHDFNRFKLFASHKENTINIQQLYFGHDLSPELQSDANRICVSDKLFDVPFIGGASLIIGNDLFQKLGQFENELTGYGNSEDTELCLRCWSFGYKVCVVPFVVCTHYTDQYRSENETKQHNLQMKHDNFKNIQRVMYLHFPFGSNIKNNLLAKYFVNIHSIVDDNLKTRKIWIEKQRKFSREWLIDRLTKMI